MKKLLKVLSTSTILLSLLTLSACDVTLPSISSTISSRGNESSSTSENKPSESSSSTSESTKPSESSSSTTTSKPTESVPSYDSLDEKYKHDVVKDTIYSGNYYDSITSTDKDTLINQLNTLINTGYQKYSYSSQTDNLKLTDTYDGNYVECLYTGQRIDKDNSAGNAGQWNKEHIWAKTYGFNDKDRKDDAYQAYSDIQMLRVTEGSINGKRSDKYFDDVTSSDSSYGCSWNDEAFEPRDEVKGDVARIMFYMIVMYNDSNLNLELTDDVSKINESAGILGGTAYLGKLSTLLKWAAEDPVDEREISRNNSVYAIQKNRNPFIDHPEYAYYIFKSECEALELSYDDFYDDNTYVASNSEAILYMNNLVDSIGEVTLEKENLINQINSYYTELDSETNSFFTGYEKLQEATYKLAQLKDLTNRDTTVDTSIDLTILSSAQGNTTKNGVSVEYDCVLATIGKGIYAQTSKAVTMKVNNLYDSIKSCEITYKCNKENPTGVITITDGTKTETLNISTTTSAQVATLDLTGFDLSKEILVTISNTKTKSIIISNITFKI